MPPTPDDGFFAGSAAPPPPPPPPSPPGAATGLPAAAAKEQHPNAVLSLVLYVVGVVGPFPLMVVGWWLGRRVQADMRQQPGRYHHEEWIDTLVRLGWIAICVWALLIGFIAASGGA